MSDSSNTNDTSTAPSVRWRARSGIVLIALTGWNADELQERLDMSAFDSQLVKPPDIDAVRRLLEASKSY